jgi:hypothetical protein
MKTAKLAGRPPKTLLEHVLSGSFRPGRHGHLFAGELLPEKPPYKDKDRREAWGFLRQRQEEYEERSDKDYRAREFSKLVRVLHGNIGPWWWRGD